MKIQPINMNSSGVILLPLKRVSITYERGITLSLINLAHPNNNQYNQLTKY